MDYNPLMNQLKELYSSLDTRRLIDNGYKGWERLGSGIARTVYSHMDAPDVVFKLDIELATCSNPEEIKYSQNYNEVLLGLGYTPFDDRIPQEVHTDLIDFVSQHMAKILDYTEDMVVVVMERLDIIDDILDSDERAYDIADELYQILGHKENPKNFSPSTDIHGGNVATDADGHTKIIDAGYIGDPGQCSPYKRNLLA